MAFYKFAVFYKMPLYKKSFLQISIGGLANEKGTARFHNLAAPNLNNQ